MVNFNEPYWVAPKDELPYTDFNKEIIPPGYNEIFPQGAVGVRVDDDFWAVAAIPYSYKDKSIKDIVSELWGEFDHVSFNPDVTVGEE